MGFQGGTSFGTTIADNVTLQKSGNTLSIKNDGVDTTQILDDAVTQDKLNANVELVPIGSILSWLKSFTNTPTLPTGFIECNGQTLSDAESVFDGQVIPDLNGGEKLLYGASTSGSTKTENFLPNHNHNLSVVNGSNGRIVGQAGSFNAGTNMIQATNSGTAWEGYSIVWIMRIK